MDSIDICRAPDRVDHGTAAPLIALGALLVLALPLFLRMPLTNDAEMYDLQAAVVRDGGILYRELLEPNLPGVVVVHLGVRALLGDSSEALRLFDLVILTLTLWSAASIVRLGGGTTRTALWTVFGLAACYLSFSEWCHCQRDVWMLAPALGACGLRLRSLMDRAPFAGPFVEGLLWGAAVWLKPYVVVPATLVWITSAMLTPSFRWWFYDVGLCLAGGLTMGAVGIGTMLSTGCWPYFVDTLQNWNPAYFAAGRAQWTWSRWLGAVVRLFPWCLLHLFAFAMTLRLACRSLTTRGHTAALPERAAKCIIAAAFLGWTFQALLLQHQFDYVFAPTVLLALLVIALSGLDSPAISRWSRLGGYGFAVIVVIGSPLTDWKRIRHWPTCLQGSVTAAVRDDLMHFRNPSQTDLDSVAEFLNSVHVRKQEVCCYNSDFVSLYCRLGLRPPVRYTYLFEILQFFPERRRQILAEVEQSPHRYVVTDLVSCGLPRQLAEEVGPEGPNAPPPAYAEAPRDIYPWSMPVVYRAGTYLVHEVVAAPDIEVNSVATKGARP